MHFYSTAGRLRVFFEAPNLTGSGGVGEGEECVMKPVIFSQHAKMQMLLRGAEESEVIEAIRKGQRQPAKRGRFQAKWRFIFERPSPITGVIYRFKEVEAHFRRGSRQNCRGDCQGLLLQRGGRTMKLYYDAQVDALYIELRPLAPGTAEARVLSEDVIANYGPDGKLAGLEVLDASLLLGEELQRLVLEISPALAPISPLG
jgi:uncharacterized protein YuzE